MSNEILPFGIGAGANVIPYADYEALAARAGGFVSGVARSEQLNTVWRQSSFVASVLAQFIANRSGQNVLDDGDTAKLLNNLELAIKTYANNNLPAASITTVGITKLSSETNSSSEVLAATPKAVKSLSDATLKTANNLSEIKLAGPAAVASAVDNLGLTEAAAAAANALKKSANLSDLIDKPLARSNLGVTAASLTNAGLVRLSDNVGSTDTTLAATINSVTYTFGQAQSKMSKASNGADIPDKAAFRLALQLGAAALLGVGTRDDIPAGSTSLLATMDCLASLIPKRSYSANDYIRIPDVPRGLMIQWGYFSSGQGVNFPTPFSVDCLTVLQIPQSADTGAHGLIYHQTLSFNAQGFLRNAAASSVPCRWIAIGY